MGRVILSGWETLRVTLNIHVWDAVHLLSLDTGLFPSGSGASRNPSLGVVIVWLVGLSFGVG